MNWLVFLTGVCAIAALGNLASATVLLAQGAVDEANKYYATYLFAGVAAVLLLAVGVHR